MNVFLLIILLLLSLVFAVNSCLLFYKSIDLFVLEDPFLQEGVLQVEGVGVQLVRVGLDELVEGNQVGVVGLFKDSPRRNCLVVQVPHQRGFPYSNIARDHNRFLFH